MPCRLSSPRVKFCGSYQSSTDNVYSLGEAFHDKGSNSFSGKVLQNRKGIADVFKLVLDVEERLLTCCCYLNWPDKRKRDDDDDDDDDDICCCMATTDF